MRIQHNIMAMNAYRNYNTNTSALSKNLEKLSSGYKINRAGDDAAGLAISEKMRAQITGLNAAQKNVKDGISLVKTGEGAMQEIQDMLNRMDYLATQSANGTYDNDVDRKNLQKEVDALKSEINRIADSANFNGIKLLDGKAGINTSAFTFEGVSAVAAQPGGAVGITFAQQGTSANGTDWHVTEDGVAAQAPKFTIDLGDLKLDTTGMTAGSMATVTVHFGSASITVGITAAAGTAGVFSAASIADAIVSKFNAVNVGGIASAGGTVGSYVFAASASGSEINFTLVGKENTAGTFDAFGADDIKTADAAALNGLDGIKGGAVSVDAGTDAVITGQYNHKVDNVAQAIAKADGKRAGITFELDDSVLSNGSTITIDNKTFTVMLDSSNTATAGADDIDLRKFANASTAEKMKELVNQLSNKDTTNFDIEKTTDGKLHIDQKASSKEKYKDQADLEAVISAAAKATAGVNAGTKITVDSSKVADGDKLTIGNKTFVFTSDASKVGSGEIQVNGKDNNALLDAINNDGTFSAAIENGGVVVRDITSGAAAPVITGTGLMLQIGDTSDSYNRLAVEIGDMHVSAMKDATTGKSIADVDISNPEGASAAIQTIRSAINYVSGIRGDLGAIQNRLEHTANNLSVMAENIQDAESTIRDTDVAEEMMAYTKNNILVQSAQAMLAQANAVPQGVLQLLG